MGRSIQDLLEERRQNVLEQSHEDDPIARQMLQAHIDYIDQQIEEADYIDRANADANTIYWNPIDRRDYAPSEDE